MCIISRFISRPALSFLFTLPSEDPHLVYLDIWEFDHKVAEEQARAVGAYMRKGTHVHIVHRVRGSPANANVVLASYKTLTLEHFEEGHIYAEGLSEIGESARDTDSARGTRRMVIGRFLGTA